MKKPTSIEKFAGNPISEGALTLAAQLVKLLCEPDPVDGSR